MSWRRQIARLHDLFGGASSARELDEEIRAHLEFETEENRAAGMPADEARYAARRRFGNVTLAKEESRDMWIYRSLEMFLQDVRFGLRMLAKNLGFTIVAVLTLALGVGANTEIFSLVNALMRKRLPYAHPERMGTIYTRVTGGPDASDGRFYLNGERWEVLRDDVPSLLSAVFGSRASGVNLGLGSQGQYLYAGRISAHYLDVLAMQPLLGRNFSADEDPAHGPRAGILSYRLLRNTFRSDPNILGQPILLKGEPHTVIGVLPDATTPLNADVYTALQASREGEGRGTNFMVITRLRDGASWQQVDAETNRAWSLRTERYELTNNPDAQVTYYSVPLQKGETDSLRPLVLALMLAARFLFLC